MNKKKIKNLPKLLGALICSLFIFMTINTTTITETNTLFIDVKDKVLAYNTTLNKIDPGVLEPNENFEIQENVDGSITFQILVGRSATIENVSEDYIINFENNLIQEDDSTCSITKITRGTKELDSITYSNDDSDTSLNYVTVVCEKESFNNYDLSINIIVDEILNSVRLYETRTLVFNYSKKSKNLDYEELFNTMWTILSSVDGATKENVKDYMKYYKITSNTQNFEDINIPGISSTCEANGTNCTFTINNEEELKKDFKEYINNKKFYDNIKDADNVIKDFPSTVKYLKGALKVESPLSSFLNRTDKTISTYYIYFDEEKNYYSIIEIDVNNSIMIKKAEDITNLSFLNLYLPILDSSIDDAWNNDIIKYTNYISEKFCILNRIENKNNRTVNFVLSTSSDVCPYNASIIEDTPKEDNSETDITIKYNELITKLEKNYPAGFGNTIRYINSLELDTNNYFYQYLVNKETKSAYYIYYETDEPKNNNSSEFELASLEDEENSDTIEITYLTLIEMSETEIKLSKFDSDTGILENIISNKEILGLQCITDTTILEEVVNTINSMIEKIETIYEYLYGYDKTTNTYKVLANITIIDRDNYDFADTLKYITKLELDDNNYFYQYYINENNNKPKSIYYIYYETKDKNSNSNEPKTVTLSEENNNVDEVEIAYLTLIKMDKDRITISKFDTKTLENIISDKEELELSVKCIIDEELLKLVNPLMKEILESKDIIAYSYSYKYDNEYSYNISRITKVEEPTTPEDTLKTVVEAQAEENQSENPVNQVALTNVYDNSGDDDNDNENSSVETPTNESSSNNLENEDDSNKEDNAEIPNNETNDNDTTNPETDSNEIGQESNNETPETSVPTSGGTIDNNLTETPSPTSIDNPNINISETPVNNTVNLLIE